MDGKDGKRKAITQIIKNGHFNLSIVKELSFEIKKKIKKTLERKLKWIKNSKLFWYLKARKLLRFLIDEEWPA